MRPSESRAAPIAAPVSAPRHLLAPTVFLAIAFAFIVDATPGQPFPWPSTVDAGVTAGGAIGEQVEITAFGGQNAPTFLAASLRQNGSYLTPPFAILLNGVVSTQTVAARVHIPSIPALVGLPVHFQSMVALGSTPYFSPTQTWHIAPNAARRFQRVRALNPGLRQMPMDRADVVLGDGSYLFTGGRRVTDVVPNPPLTTVFHYNPVRDTFARMPGLTSARAGHAAVRLSNGQVLLVGGETGSPTAELFDPVRNRFTSLGAVPHGFTHPLAVRFRDLANRNEYVLIGGGYNRQSRNTNAMLYDVANNTFSTLPKMRVGRVDAAGIAVPGGVLISGGYDATTVHNDVELFSLATRSFHPWGTMQKRRCSHAMVSLTPTTVLIIGGFDGAVNLRDIEVFDGLRRTSSPAPFGLAIPRSGIKAIPLAGGALFISHESIGGFTGEVLSSTGSTLLRPIYDRHSGVMIPLCSALFFPGPTGGVVAFGWSSQHSLQ